MEALSLITRIKVFLNSLAGSNNNQLYLSEVRIPVILFIEEHKDRLVLNNNHVCGPWDFN